MSRRPLRRPRVSDHRILGAWTWQSSVAQACVALIVGQALIAGWIQSQNYWYFDDYYLLWLGAHSGWADPAMLFHVWAGHLMPAGFLLSQFAERLAGWEFTGIALALVLAQVLINTLMLRLLVRHWGLRWRIVPPLALTVFSIPVLQAATWWAAAINMLPALILGLISTDHLLSWVTFRHRSDLIWVIAALVGALIFFEKAALLPVALLGLAWTLQPEKGLRNSVAGLVRAQQRLIVAVAAVMTVWLVVYALSPTSSGAAEPAPTTLADTIGIGLAARVVTSLVGGWHPWVSAFFHGYGHAPSPIWLVVLTLQLAGLLVLVTSCRSERAQRSWMVVAVYTVLTGVALSSGRSMFIGSGLVPPRYFADLIVVLAVALAMATMRLLADSADTPEGLPAATGRPRVLLTATSLAVANLMLVNYVLSATTLGQVVAAASPREYVQRAVAGLRALGPDVTVLDGPPPLGVTLPTMGRVSMIFDYLQDGPQFSTVTHELIVVTDDGQVGKARLVGARSNNHTPICAVPSSPQVSIALRPALFPWTHVAGIDYTSDAAGTVAVGIPGGSVVDVPVEIGRHSVYFVIRGAGQTARITTDDLPGDFCVRTLTIGAPALV